MPNFPCCLRDTDILALLSSPSFDRLFSANMDSSSPPKVPACTDPVIILWDYENCHVPRGVQGHFVATRFHELFRQYGSIVGINAYAPVGMIPLELRNQLQLGSVNMIDATALQGNGKKDVVDKMIFTALFVFALDHKPPATIVLISGDVDYAVPLSTLKLRGYNIILVPPPAVSRALLNIPTSVISWNSLVAPVTVAIESRAATQTGSVPPSSAQASSSNVASNSQDLPEEELSLDEQSDFNPVCTVLDLLDICIDYYESTSRTSLLASQAGLMLQKKYPQGFRKRIMATLVPIAVNNRWMSTSGSGGSYTLHLDPFEMQLEWDTVQRQMEVDSDTSYSPRTESTELDETTSRLESLSSSLSLLLPPGLAPPSSSSSSAIATETTDTLTPLPPASPLLLRLLDICLDVTERNESRILCSQAGILLSSAPGYQKGTMSPLVDQATRAGWLTTSGFGGALALVFHRDRLLLAKRRYSLNEKPQASSSSAPSNDPGTPSK